MEQSIYEMVEENNEMLKKLLKKGRWGMIFKVIKYIIILIVITGLWYYAKPYLDQARGVYIKVNETTDSIDALDFSNISNLFNNE